MPCDANWLRLIYGSQGEVDRAVNEQTIETESTEHGKPVPGWLWQIPPNSQLWNEPAKEYWSWTEGESMS